ncbi:MAG TPA: glycosyltransferase [Mucilaginibacter sp.]|nr:glycosyltransferase [Mucilaginibacter sp.]
MANHIENKLAVVIPAYKIHFFKETLDSLAAQTNKNFTLYIGDDCSPHNFPELITDYSGTINIVYKRFDKNLGGDDLVANWERCIDMIGEEEWVWLFSDDDIMAPSCVENFYKELNDGTPSMLYHFNVLRIDQEGKVIATETDYPAILKGTDFINKLINFEITSYVVEYIFNKGYFYQMGRFKNFDLAWGSDHATWFKLSFNGYIKTIADTDTKVRWRTSDFNITSINTDIALSLRKRKAELDFYKWLTGFFAERSAPLPFSVFSATRWIVQGMVIHIERYGWDSVSQWITLIAVIQGGKLSRFRCYGYLMLYLTIKKIRKVFK